MRKYVIDNDNFMRDLAAQESLNRIREVAEGLLINTAELGRRLGIANHSVDDLAKAGKIFSLEIYFERQYYPAFFADPDIKFEDIEIVCKLISKIPSSSKWQFFTTPKSYLNGRTPLEALEEGDKSAVIICAKGFAER